MLTFRFRYETLATVERHNVTNDQTIPRVIWLD
ncbi:hypothetical protein [Klebsiella phage Kpn17]|uniref:Uncharacterized protein n=1 Tax=Klebsiella phage Kpn17 TaxID=3044025 RepID=A0AAT9V658_9CAUD|nr:hypothetical protein [Klebsiella phage Kpn17]